MASVPTCSSSASRAGANDRVGAREVELVEHCAGVEHGPAHEDRADPTVVAVGDDGPRPALELRDGGGLRHVEHVDEVVRDAATLGLRELRRTDVHPPVELHRVGVDDLPTESLGEVERERALARCGRTHDGDDLAGRHGR